MTVGPRSVTLARTRRELAEGLRELRADGGTVALVPTMGALHLGHMALLEYAARHADTVVVSVFVNPLQFGEGEDLERYPRDLEGDVARVTRHGARLVFAPEDRVIVPEGRSGIRVVPGPSGERLCGAFRPGHFEGVLTIVAKLFGLVEPEVAVFGRKDLQQAVLIRQMVRDLFLGVRIEVAPLVREADGLAMSSRNAYLTPDERRSAVGLYLALRAAEDLFLSGEGSAERLLSRFRDEVGRFPGLSLQYAELVEAESLDSLDRAGPGAVLAAAAYCGSTRLIDNLVLGETAPDSGPLVNGA